MKKFLIMSTEDMTNNTNKKELPSHFKYQQLMIDGNKYLLGTRKVNDFRHILLTDLTNFYEEKLSKEDSMKRVEELNPLLPDCDIDEILDDLLLNIPKYATSCTLQCIELENRIEDGRFWFHIKLTNADAKQFLDQYTENFYICFSQLYHRYNCLLDLVKKKDREIDEYKAQGASIVKKSLMTEPFNEKLFQTKLKKVEPVEKMAVFLETMSFFNSLNVLHSNDLQKNELLVAGPEKNTGDSEVLSTNKKIVVKRPASGDIRCAVIPKIGKKTKQPKQNSFLKQI